MHCLDASVIVNSLMEKEPYCSQSKAFLNMVQEKNIKTFFPEIVIPEISSGLFRATKDENFIFQFTKKLRPIPNFHSFLLIQN